MIRKKSLPGQDEFWVKRDSIRAGRAKTFYDGLVEHLDSEGFGDFVRELCAPFYHSGSGGGRISEPGFAQWSGLAGGLILMGFGITAFFKDHRGEEKTPGFDARSYRDYFLKGFLVNFVNPVTFFFWTSVMTTYVVTRKSGGLEVLLVFGSILVTIICTDSLKVALAKSIRSKLKRHHINYLGKIAGLLLVGFGISLIVRTSFL